jgi:hypothetical protein
MANSNETCTGRCHRAMTRRVKVEIMRGKAVDVNVVILPSGVGLRSVKRLDGYGARLYPPSRPHPTSSNSITALHRTPPRRPYKTSFNHGYELLSYIWRSLWKKRNACVFICRFCHVTPTFSILTLLFRHSYGNAHLLAPHE